MRRGNQPRMVTVFDAPLPMADPNVAAQWVRSHLGLLQDLEQKAARLPVDEVKWIAFAKIANSLAGLCFDLQAWISESRVDGEDGEHVPVSPRGSGAWRVTAEDDDATRGEPS